MSIFDRLRALLRGRSENGAEPSRTVNGEEGSVEMIPCEEALRRVHEYLDGELDDVSESEVRQHFEVCQRCYPHLRLESAFREALRRATACDGAPDELKARVVALLEDARSGG